MKGKELQAHLFHVNIHSVQIDVPLGSNACIANIVFLQAHERSLELLDNQFSHFADLGSQFGQFEIKRFVACVPWPNSILPA